MATDDEEDAPYKGPALRPDGQITGRTDAASPPDALENRFLSVELPRATSGELELVERPPKPWEPPVERFRPEPPPPRKSFALKLVIVAALLGAGLLAAMLLSPPRAATGGPAALRENDLLDSILAGGEKPPLVIESTPPGADILIAGQKIGQTPWAGDNAFPAGASVLLELPGYARWQVKLKANEAQTISAKLQRTRGVDVNVDVGTLEHVETPR